MKSVFAVLGIVLAQASMTQACPGLTFGLGAHVEISGGCDQLQPDYSQAVVLNQADPSNGGECRIDPKGGSAFFVVGKDLVLVDSSGEKQHIGILTEEPYCYQTDPGDNYEYAWTGVLLDSTPTFAK